jgi:MFS family permease
MSVGPLVAALTGVPAGRSTDRFGTARMTIVGLGGMAVGSLGLALVPVRMGVVGYIAPVSVITAGYALFQTANNTAIVGAAGAARRGVAAGMLSLARNVGLMAGVALMGAVFARGAGNKELAEAAGGDVASGTRWVFLVAVGMTAMALGVAGLVERRTPLRPLKAD